MESKSKKVSYKSPQTKRLLIKAKLIALQKGLFFNSEAVQFFKQMVEDEAVSDSTCAANIGKECAQALLWYKNESRQGGVDLNEQRVLRVAMTATTTFNPEMEALYYTVGHMLDLIQLKTARDKVVEEAKKHVILAEVASKKRMSNNNEENYDDEEDTLMAIKQEEEEEILGRIAKLKWDDDIPSLLLACARTFEEKSKEIKKGKPPAKALEEISKDTLINAVMVNKLGFAKKQ